MNESHLLKTEHEVAEALRVSVAALRRWRTEKRGPKFYKLASEIGNRGGLVRYRMCDVEDWLAQQTTGGGEGK